MSSEARSGVRDEKAKGAKILYAHGTCACINKHQWACPPYDCPYCHNEARAKMISE